MSEKEKQTLCYYMNCERLTDHFVRFRNGDVRGYCREHASEIIRRAENSPYGRSLLAGATLDRLTEGDSQ